MYFDDEKDLEKDDNFSLDDDGSSISWEDLLNSDEDIDLEKLVKKDAIADLKEDLKADNIEGIISETETPMFDMDLTGKDNEPEQIINALPEADESILDSSIEPDEILKENPVLNNDEEPVLKNLDDLSRQTTEPETPVKKEPVIDETLDIKEPLESEIKTEEISSDKNENKEFDIKAAAANYMNSLSADDMGILNEIEEPAKEDKPKEDDILKDIPLADEKELSVEAETKEEIKISLDEDIPQTEEKSSEITLLEDEKPTESSTDEIKSDEISIDDIPVANDFVFESDNKDEVMGVIDDELLSMLDTNSDMSDFADSSVLNAADTDSIDAIVQADDSEIQSVTEEEYNPDVISDIDDIQQADDADDNTDVPLEENEEFLSDDDMGDEMPLPSKKKGFPLLLAACMLGLTAIIALAVYIFVFPKNQNESAEVLAGGNEILSQPSPETSETVASNEDPDSITIEQAQESAKAQREELINKLEENKAENKDKKETKKVVVNITTSGRTNPFLPSLMFGKDGFAQVGTDLSSPPDETMLAPDASQARKMLSITVSGIMFDPSKPSAIVRFGGMDYFVQRGDRIDNYQITQITKDYVSIKNGVNTYKAFVGETLTTESTVDDINSVKTINGSRQYISTNDIEINKTGAGG